MEGRHCALSRSLARGSWNSKASLRIRESELGRVLAINALAKIGVASKVLPALQSGAPDWPAGVTGSISHSHGHVVVLVAETSVIRGVGIDIELVPPPNICDQLEYVCLHPAEVKQVLNSSELNRALAVTVLFSAKEAIFKCLYPLLNRCLGFLDMECLSMDGDCLIFQLRQSLAPEFPCGYAVGVRFAFSNGFVYTFAQVS